VWRSSLCFFPEEHIRVSFRFHDKPLFTSQFHGFRCSVSSLDSNEELIVNPTPNIDKVAVSGSGKYKIGDEISIIVISEDNVSGTFQIVGVTGKEPFAPGMFSNQY